VEHGDRHLVRARGEIVVCGGVYGPPQLLQLSGLGPAALSQQFGIPVVRDIPAVGADLQDHFYVRLAFRCTRPITLNDVANHPMKKLLAGLQLGDKA
jgi:choline dehydrogenase